MRALLVTFRRPQAVAGRCWKVKYIVEAQLVVGSSPGAGRVRQRISFGVRRAPQDTANPEGLDPSGLAAPVTTPVTNCLCWRRGR